MHEGSEGKQVILKVFSFLVTCQLLSVEFTMLIDTTIPLPLLLYKVSLHL